MITCGHCGNELTQYHSVPFRTYDADSESMVDMQYVVCTKCSTRGIGDTEEDAIEDLQNAKKCRGIQGLSFNHGTVQYRKYRGDEYD